jgi:signal transduction histidine kinase
MALSAIIVAITLSRTVESIEKEFEELNDRTLQISSLLQEIRFSGLRIVSSTSEYLLIVATGHYSDTGEIQNAASSRLSEVEEIQTAEAALENQLGRYRELVLAYFPDELEFLEIIGQQRDQLIQQGRTLMLIDPNITDITKLAEAKEGFEKTEIMFLQAVDLALKNEIAEYDEKVTGLKNSIKLTNILIWVGLIGAAILILILGGATTRSIVRPLVRLSGAIENVRKGDYSQELRANKTDEIGRLADSFNSMADRLQKNKRLQQEFIEQLEQKNTELERFTYTVSHDLKSPLVTVKGFLGMLEKDIETGQKEAIDKDIDFLKTATDTMGELLNDLLQLSRVGRVINPSTLTSMTDLCNEVVSALQGSIKERHAEIKIMPDMPNVYADRGRIKEVIQNLLENAIKFSRNSDHPKINIYSETRASNALFIVEDNGIGIESAYHDKIFVLFERLDAKTDGTGVGLALVKRIVETHGGEIWIESPVELEGSRFCFTLPHSMPASNLTQPLAAS